MPFKDPEKRRAFERKRWKYHGHVSREQKRRKRQEDPAYAVFWDAVKSDRRFSRENDLDLEYVRQETAKACTYCGGTELRMTLDRIDNSKGHTKSNVIPSCERCNFVRRDMPYEAWLIVAQAMREATSKNLFGGWTCSIHAKRRNVTG